MVQHYVLCWQLSAASRLAALPWRPMYTVGRRLSGAVLRLPAAAAAVKASRMADASGSSITSTYEYSPYFTVGLNSNPFRHVPLQQTSRADTQTCIESWCQALTVTVGANHTEYLACTAGRPLIAGIHAQYIGTTVTTTLQTPRLLPLAYCSSQTNQLPSQCTLPPPTCQDHHQGEAVCMV